MHLPVVRDLEQMEKRIRNAFAAAESPDDVVLRARQGRAGTGALASAPAVTTGPKRA
jgi:elongation factor 1 alpha-like protein